MGPRRVAHYRRDAKEAARATGAEVRRWTFVRVWLVRDRRRSSRLGETEGDGVGRSLRSVLVLSPREILPLRLTFHPSSYIVYDKALLSPSRGVAFI